MEIKKLLQTKNISMYKLAKLSGIPYTTVNDICSGRTRLEKCSGETIYKLARILNVTMEELLTPYICKRIDFENYKSAVCHRVKEAGEINFIIETLESGEIRKNYDRKWYPECFYLLAMLDYLSRENNIPLCRDYDDLRSMKLKKIIYPAGFKALAAASRNVALLEQSVRESIPEFIRFNIVENEVRDVA